MGGRNFAVGWDFFFRLVYFIPMSELYIFVRKSKLSGLLKFDEGWIEIYLSKQW